MKWLKNNFPNLLTCTNLACGVYGIFLLSVNGTKSIDTIEILVIVAGIADFFDGFSARILKSTSNIGKDLDSLADNVTFGVLPSLLLFLIIRDLAITKSINEGIALFALPIAIFSSVRLAIFNNDEKQSEQFIGVPTPGNAFFLVFLIGSLLNQEYSFLFNPISLISVCIVSSLWLVAPFALIALKFKNFSFGQNWPRYLIIVFSFILILFYGKSSIPLIFLAYIALSLSTNFLRKNEL